jgi:hypothetical protein
MLGGWEGWRGWGARFALVLERLDVGLILYKEVLRHTSHISDRSARSAIFAIRRALVSLSSGFRFSCMLRREGQDFHNQRHTRKLAQ